MPVRVLLGLVGRLHDGIIGQPGHHGFGALEVTGVDPVHGRLDGGQIGLQHLELGIFFRGINVGLDHAGESTVGRCPPR